MHRPVANSISDRFHLHRQLDRIARHLVGPVLRWP
jgi:hypothetical protein